ncbi:MAG: permease [Verrucomicrobiales bacterium]|nr:permease [Verrucomicrobiales bacterium]MBP9223836.1 permease [Verrucomicrobiales bacterium]
MDSAALSPFNDFCLLFLSIVLEGAPFILLGTLVSGFIDAYLPAGLIDRWLPKNKVLAIFLSGLLGAIFPVCECAIVPVIRRLIRKGLPVSCAITYMLSAPIINPIVVVSTMKAFSSSVGKFSLRETDANIAFSPLFMTSSRLLLAFIVTVAVGLIVLKIRSRSILKPGIVDERQLEREEQEETHDHSAHGHGHLHVSEKVSPQPDRLVLAMRTTMRDFTETAMYFTIGVAITSVFKAYVTEDLILLFNQSEATGVGLMMVLAFVLSLCSTSDAFIAANFPVPQSAKLAFLVFGPMMDVKLVFMYLAVFKSRFVITLAIGLFFVIGILSYLWFRI